MSPSGQPSEHTPQHLEEMKAAFALFDRDGSGSIDAVELKALLKAMDQHPSPLELEELLQQMDTDGNGVIDFNEFAAVMGDQFEDNELESELQELRSMFVMLDQDGNGRLSSEELRRAMKLLGVNLSPAESDYLLKEIDTDGDGDVSFEEFTTYVWNFKGDDEGEENHKKQ